ncbi:hypothetical protein ABZS66_19325 [Dactylosporangium sp. NPDC005572]|uniref:hypothetical protein n=1 Tax=Dactylosporangium sp. NPDC005572 TaxID=3156889 RepID=UPI0033B7E227
MHGVSYNLVLIGVPLLFWAAVRWRTIAAWAVRGWREHRAQRAARAAEAGVFPGTGHGRPADRGPQVTPPDVSRGRPSERPSGEGPGDPPGKTPPPAVETRGDGVTGVWITVPRADGTAGGRDG